MLLDILVSYIIKSLINIFVASSNSFLLINNALVSVCVSTAMATLCTLFKKFSKNGNFWLIWEICVISNSFKKLEENLFLNLEISKSFLADVNKSLIALFSSRSDSIELLNNIYLTSDLYKFSNSSVFLKNSSIIIVFFIFKLSSLLLSNIFVVSLFFSSFFLFSFLLLLLMLLFSLFISSASSSPPSNSFLFLELENNDSINFWLNLGWLLNIYFSKFK